MKKNRETAKVSSFKLKYKYIVLEQTLESVAAEAQTFQFGFLKKYLETAHVFLFERINDQYIY